MKKIYQTPMMDSIMLNNEDILTLSAGLENGTVDNLTFDDYFVIGK